MAAPEVRTLTLWQTRVETEIEITGSGPSLVYLHGPWGIAPDRAFIERLAGSHTVYAPKHPGTSRGNHEAVHALDSWLERGAPGEAGASSDPCRRRRWLRRWPRTC